jgi:segregation and condensation protein B
VTRAEIEEIRGVTTSAGTLDILMEAGWIRPRGRRRAPGKPLTYGTTDSFLAHFGLDGVKDLPGLADLKAQGLLDGHLPPGFTVPDPSIAASLLPDELPLEETAEEETSEADAELPFEGDGEEAESSDGREPTEDDRS